jgi:tetratricopeptide (TPR) repeat protein
VIRGDGQLSLELVAQQKLAVVPSDESPNAALRRLAILAEVQLVGGDLPGALTSASQLIQTLPQSNAAAYDGDRERRASLVAGKVHMLQGHPEMARPLIVRAVDLADGRLNTSTSPQHADALIWLGMAQLAMGHRQEAKKLADQAKEIHDRHPQLAEAFRKPLADLNSRLKAPSHS